MTLILRPTKNGVRFEHSDEDTETSVYIDKADTDKDMIRKMQRVIALVEGAQAPEPPNVDPLPAGVATALDRAYAGTAPTNGWAAAFEPPALPERLKGEVEFIQPGEEA